MSLSERPVFNYVVALQGREFIVTIFEDGTSHWDDLSQGCLLDRLQGEETDGAVAEVAISDEIFAKARSMSEKERIEEARTGQFLSPEGRTAEDIKQMDRLMTDFFWREVNPVLAGPLKQ